MDNQVTPALKTTKSNNRKEKGTSPRKDIKDILRGEMMGHLVTYLLLSVVFQLVFYRESIVVVQRFLGGLYWIFIFPGATLLLAGGDRWGFVERVVAGSALALAVVGTVSYYLGILGLHVRYHGWLLTPMLLTIGVVALAYWKKKKK